MGGQCRIYGLMAGITIGFAVWGSAGYATGQEYGSEWRYAATATGNGSGAGEIAAAQTEALSLHAQSAVLMDGDTGRILYEKNGDQFRPMASTTKIMTCILALEEGGKEEICTVSEQAASQPKVHLGASKGTQFYMKDLLYSLMLESHNDSAVMIAEQIGKSVEGFAGMMNQKAKDLGCTDTCFITPNGLDAAKEDSRGEKQVHGTTARDLASIMRYCVMQSPKKEEFLDVTRTQNYSFTDVSGKYSYSCVNHNALLQMMEGALSGKTGFTGGAGYSYVGAMESEGRTYILALLGCGWPPHKTYKWADARQLFSYGKEAYHYREFQEHEDGISIPVVNGIVGDWDKQAAEGQLFIYDQAQISAREMIPEEELQFSVLMGENEKLVRKVEIPEKLQAPIGRGEFVGRVVYSLEGMEIKSFPLYADRDVEQKEVKHYARQILALFLLPS